MKLIARSTVAKNCSAAGGKRRVPDLAAGSAQPRPLLGVEAERGEIGPGVDPFQVRQPRRGPSSVPIVSAPYAITGMSVRWRRCASRRATRSRRRTAQACRGRRSPASVEAEATAGDVAAQHPFEERGRIRVRDVGAEVDQVESRAIGSNGGLRVVDLDRTRETPSSFRADATVLANARQRSQPRCTAIERLRHAPAGRGVPPGASPASSSPVRWRGQQPVGWCGVLGDGERAPIDCLPRSLAAAPRRVADRLRR